MRRPLTLHALGWFLILCCLAGCATLPEGLRPVEGFALERYLGRWYEIARLDHPFERGLVAVSADYSLRPDGGVRVLNRGYSAEEGRWKEAEGRGYFVGPPDQGFLKVSFFGPFYGSYVIIELDRKGYRHALVCGPDRTYLWLLARSPRIDETLKRRLINRAAELGFDTGGLIEVRHDRPCPPSEPPSTAQAPLSPPEPGIRPAVPAS